MQDEENWDKTESGFPEGEGLQDILPSYHDCAKQRLTCHSMIGIKCKSNIATYIKDKSINWYKWILQISQTNPTISKVLGSTDYLPSSIVMRGSFRSLLLILCSPPPSSMLVMDDKIAWLSWKQQSRKYQYSASGPNTQHFQQGKHTKPKIILIITST